MVSDRDRTCLPIVTRIILTSLLLITITACGRNRSQAVFVANPVEEKNTGPSSGSESADQASRDSDEQDPPAPHEPVPEASGELFDRGIAMTVRLVNPLVDGSGVILGREGADLYLLTVWHVAKERISQVDVFTVEQQRPLMTLREPEVVEKNERLDLALLKVRVHSDMRFPTAMISASKDPKFGYSVGCSDGKYPTLMSERITGQDVFRVKERSVQGLLWTTDKPQSAGRSGGPLLDVKGGLLGIALGKKGSVGFYCHSSEISKFLIDSTPKGLLRWPKLK